MLEAFKRSASRIQSIPLLNFLIRAPNCATSLDDRTGFLRCQRLAQESVTEISKLIRDGWSEVQTADMIETYLRDSGVRTFFHKPYAWFGERTRFDGIKGYQDFMPRKDRVLLPHEPFLLDVAPIYKGYIADIGFSDCLTPHPDFEKARHFLLELRAELPKIFSEIRVGHEIYRVIERRIEEAGFENRHRFYPFGVLGHRIYRVNEALLELNLLNFGWQSFWSLLSRGLYGQLLTQDSEGDLTGLWAIEPHIGGKDFGAKFEEILMVENGSVKWLEEKECISHRPL